MAESTTTQVQAEPTPVQVSQTEPQIDEQQAKIDAAIQSAQESWKKELAGLNRRNSDLEKKLQEKELEKLSELDRAKKETELAQTERDKIINETLTLKRENAAVNAGLDKEFAKRINGGTEEEILADINSMNAIIEREVSKRMEAERNKLLGGRAPVAGQTPTDTSYQAQYAEAMKNGQMALAVQIKLEAQRQGIIIK